MTSHKFKNSAPKQPVAAWNVFRDFCITLVFQGIFDRTNLTQEFCLWTNKTCVFQKTIEEKQDLRLQQSSHVE